MANIDYYLKQFHFYCVNYKNLFESRTTIDTFYVEFKLHIVYHIIYSIRV